MLFTAKQTVQQDHGLLQSHPPPYVPGPYAAPRPLFRVPSLVSLCVRALAPFADQAHRLPVRLHPRFLHDLLPEHPSLLDPRLWAVVVQVFDPLPPAVAAYSLPLADVHLPLLQAIPSTPSFSLVTLLTLSSCSHLTDDTIVHLKFLHALTALDASNNALSAYALQSLAATLQLNDSQDALSYRGPWPIRILNLRNCRQITNDVLPFLLKFPLLSVIGPFHASCSLSFVLFSFQTSAARAVSQTPSLSSALSTLYDIQRDLFSSPNPAVINIETLYHPSTKSASPSSVTPQDAFVVIPSDRSRIKVGNSVILEKQIQAREEARAHEQNKAAWYDRQERLESRWDGESVKQHTVSPFPSKHSAPTDRLFETLSHSRPARRVGETWFDTSPFTRDRPTISSRAHPASHSSLPSSSRASAAAEMASHSTGPANGDRAPSTSARPAVPTEQFYKSVPRVSSKEGNPNSSLRIERRRIPETLLSSMSKEGTFDDRLRLYRPPPPWSALDDTLSDLREQEARARQEREWQRQNAAAERQDGQLAVVNMNNARAARVKRELERVVEEAAKRRKVLDVEDEIEDDDTRLPLPSGHSRPIVSAIPMSNLSISSSSSNPPPQPLVTESTARNPFRRRRKSFPASSCLPASNSTRASPSSVDSDTPMQGPPSTAPSPSDEDTRPRNKPLVPISSLVVPTLTPEMQETSRKEAAELSSGKKTKPTTRSPNTTRTPKASGASGPSNNHGQFDWKSWGKPT
ncbi:hypothetical protein CVT26_001210 [Gymnopilus dilepis]|uniref:Uncharacterized protein n=1 Tax=Gymnopilus dilepis TaxID=231916 RepID=A0A409YUM8_9AGAR|nr:hypothetical protein CVT26_001210 [Gymnopilus dilepis]